MICDACQTRNNYYHKFCYHCGVKLNIPYDLKDKVAADLPSMKDGEEVQEEEMNYPQDDLLVKSHRKSIKRRYLVITFGIIIILVAAAIYIWFSVFMGSFNKLEAQVPLPTSIVSSIEKQKTTPSPVPTVTPSVIPVTFNITEPSTLSVQTQTGIYTIKGTIDVKSKIVTDAEVITPFFVDAANGTFSITVKLPEAYKIYPVTITAKNEGELEKSIVLQMERIVNEEAYRNSAIDISYQELVAKPKQYIGTVTKYVGRIRKVTQMEKSVQFTLDTSYYINRPMSVEYLGDTTIKEGKRILLIGEITDMKDGKPAILARLGYKINY